jgi:hypothetical protein
MCATTKISAAELQDNFGRRVVVLNEANSEEAAELFHALARPCRTPEAVVLDHLIDGDAGPDA